MAASQTLLRAPSRSWLLPRRLGQRTQRAPVMVQASTLAKALATTAALGVTAVTLRQVLIHQQQRQSGAGQQQQRGQGEGDGPSTVLEGVGSSSSGSSSWNVHAVARGLQLPGWLLASREQKKERQLQHTVHAIEQRQRREAERELRQWDQRLSLRTKTLGELRALAQRHNIAGRSRMRKRELVAALETVLGFASAQQSRA